MSDQNPAMGPTEMAEWLGTEEVPGYPGFVWHSKIGQTTPDLEKDIGKVSIRRSCPFPSL